jgi:hypothetical protein
VIFLFSLHIESRRGKAQDHVRFSPVMILQFPPRLPGVPPILLPFAGASLLAVCVPLLFPGLAPARNFVPAELAGALIGEDAYRAHAAFQAAFSYQPLSGTGEPYYQYALGDDGLIRGVLREQPRESPEIPPFPLADLMRFLEGAGDAPVPRGGETVSLITVLLLALPALIKPLWGGTKRKKTLLYKRKRMTAGMGRLRGRYYHSYRQTV